MTTLVRAPTRPYQTMLMDSARWDGFRPRPDDIVVATYPKCGTTWMQRIVDLLIHQSTDARSIMETYPWLDAKFFAPIEANLATLEAQTHRRAIKTHLPFDSLPIFEGVKYIHVARDGRDACFSYHNHMLGMTENAAKAMAEANNLPPGAGPPPTPEDPHEFYRQWIGQAEAGGDGIGADLPYFEYEMTYWRERARPNLLLVHYADLKADLAGEMARISDFLEIETPPATLEKLAAAAQFEAMKSQGADLLSNLHGFFDRGHERFLNKGVNGRWQGVLDEDDLSRYGALAAKRLSPAAAAWLEKGRLATQDPLKAVD